MRQLRGSFEATSTVETSLLSLFRALFCSVTARLATASLWPVPLHRRRLPRYRSFFFSTINLFLTTNDYMHLIASIADSHPSQGRCHGCRQLWPPWRPHGHGPGGPRPLQQVHDLQPQEPRLGEPRPLRPLVRSTLHTCGSTLGQTLSMASFVGVRSVVEMEGV